MMEGSSGLVPAHLRMMMGFPGTNSIVWDSSESDLDSDIRNWED